MTEQNPWRHSLDFDRNPTGTSAEPTPRVSFIVARSNFTSFEIFPNIIRAHDISRYPSVGLSRIQQLESMLEATGQPHLPQYAVTLFEIGQTLSERLDSGKSEQEALSEIYTEWNEVLEEQAKINITAE